MADTQSSTPDSEKPDREKPDSEERVRPVGVPPSTGGGTIPAGAGSVAVPAPGSPSPRESRWRVAGCFLLLLAAIQLVLGPKIRLSQWEAAAETNGRISNAAIAEGVAWLYGELDLPCEGDARDPANRPHDTACFDGRVYNVFPPLLAFLTVILSPLHASVLHLPEGMWSPQTYVLLAFWSLPITGFVVFRRRVGDSAWAAVLTLAWMGGTAVLPNLNHARTAYLGEVNHVLSQIGLLILAADLLGRQRIWPGLIGLLIATYTRQITFLYGLPLLWAAWRNGGLRRFALSGVGLAVIAAPLLALNHLKFDDPFDFGYQYIYVGREDEPMGQRCVTYGTFSTRYLTGIDAYDPGNAYFMHLAPPTVDFKELSLTGLPIRDRNGQGISLWITTPLALWVLIAAPRWWRDRKARVLMLGTLPVMIGVLCYHSPGYLEHGYSRFALDFLPVWLVVIAPMARGGRGGWRTWLSLAMIAWSLLYFQSIVPNAPMTRFVHLAPGITAEHHV